MTSSLLDSEAVQNKGVASTSNTITGNITAAVDTTVTVAVGSAIAGAFGTPTMADSASNTWTLRASGFNTVAALGGICLFDSVITSAINTSTTFTVASHPSNAAWAWILDVWADATFVDASAFNRSSSTNIAPQNTISTAGIGGICLGFVVWNNSAASETSDTDTTNGTWVTPDLTIGTTGGTATTNAAIVRQYKIPTAIGGQTWNVTLTATSAYSGFLLEYKPAPFGPNRFMSFFH